jgi:hypothetical protein
MVPYYPQDWVHWSVPTSHLCLFVYRKRKSKKINSLTAIVAYYVRPLIFELCTILVSFRIFVRCQRLIARNLADGFLLFSLADTF